MRTTFKLVYVCLLIINALFSQNNYKNNKNRPFATGILKKLIRHQGYIYTYNFGSITDMQNDFFLYPIYSNNSLQGFLIHKIGSYEYTKEILEIVNGNGIQTICGSERKYYFPEHLSRNISEEEGIFLTCDENWYNKQEDKKLLKLIKNDKEFFKTINSGKIKHLEYCFDAAKYGDYDEEDTKPCSFNKFFTDEFFISPDNKIIFVSPYIYYDIGKNIFNHTGLKFHKNLQLLGALNSNLILLYKKNKTKRKIEIYKYRFNSFKPLLYRILYFKSKINNLFLNPKGKFLLVNEQHTLKNRYGFCISNNMHAYLTNKKCSMAKSKKFKSFITLWLVNLKTKRKYPITVSPSLILRFLNGIQKSEHKYYGGSLYLGDSWQGPGSSNVDVSPFLHSIDKILWSPDGHKLIFTAKKYKNGINRIILVKLDNPSEWIKLSNINPDIQSLTDLRPYFTPKLNYVLDENLEPLFWYSPERIAFLYKNKYLMLFNLKSLVDTENKD